jgi:hypothetical protein
MEYLDDCPICQKIKAGKIEKETKYCCLVVIGKVRVAALKGHESDALPDALAEAFGLLRFQASDGFVGEYSAAPGHWAVQLIRTNGMPQGKSEGKSE